MLVTCFVCTFLFMGAVAEFGVALFSQFEDGDAYQSFSSAWWTVLQALAGSIDNVHTMQPVLSRNIFLIFVLFPLVFIVTSMFFAVQVC